jgi:hypothetical protein
MALTSQKRRQYSCRAFPAERSGRWKGLAGQRFAGDAVHCSTGFSWGEVRLAALEVSFYCC